MERTKLSKTLFSTSIFFLVVLSVTFAISKPLTDKQTERNSVIAYILSRQLPSIHYSDKELDDELAKAAFHLYIKQLDSQKRFLLQGDIDLLSQIEPNIDDDLRAGRYILALAGEEVLRNRILQVEGYVNSLLKVGIDRKDGDFYENDIDKISYVKTDSELKERWRITLKSQIMTRYLDLEEKAKVAAKEKNIPLPADLQLWREASEKVVKQMQSFLRRLKQETTQDHIDRFFNAVTRAFGPHTNYIAPAGKEQFDIAMSGSLEGIGALLREEDGRIKVVRIIPGSASARQGQLKAENVILEVAQGLEEPVDITDMRLKDAVRMIRGPKGTEVRLTIRQSDGHQLVIPITRDVVQMEDTFVKSSLLETENGMPIGYIYIPSFYRDFKNSKKDKNARNSTADTRKELDDLKQKGVKGIILDLRDNGGGALIDAVDVAGLFLKEGPMVQVRTSNGQKRILSDTDSSLVCDVPMVVLVNKFSASASEIVAAALQDYGRAVIIGGSHTHGKGSVQTVLELDDYIPWKNKRNGESLGALKIMIQKFYRVNGGSTQYKGVEPDIVLPSLLEHIESGERYLEYSLPWDSIEPVSYNVVENELPLSLLKSKSEQRVAVSENFKTIITEAAKSKERSLDTIIALNLQSMRDQRAELKAAKENLDIEEINPDDEEKEISKEEKDKHWRDKVSKDAWVLEATEVISDIITLNIK